MKHVLEWFSNNYVQGKLRRILRNGAEVRVSPLHPPEDWSIFQRQQLGFPRANNICEVFHSRWNSFVGHRQVNLFRFIKKLQAEEDRQMKQKQAQLVGTKIRHQKRLAYRRKEERIVSIMSQKDKISMTDFLIGIAHNL